MLHDQHKKYCERETVVLKIVESHRIVRRFLTPCFKLYFCSKNQFLFGVCFLQNALLGTTSEPFGQVK